MKHFEQLNCNAGKGINPLPQISPIGGGPGGSGTPFCGYTQVGEPPKKPDPKPGGGRG